MNKLFSYVVRGLVAAVAVGYLTQALADSCTRQIINHSANNWVLSASTSEGDVYFNVGADNSGGVKNGPYPISAGQTISIKYTSGAVNRMKGSIKAIGPNGYSHSFSYYAGGGCSDLYFDGQSGSGSIPPVVLDIPNGGSMSIYNG